MNRITLSIMAAALALLLVGCGKAEVETVDGLDLDGARTQSEAVVAELLERTAAYHDGGTSVLRNREQTCARPELDTPQVSTNWTITKAVPLAPEADPAAVERAVEEHLAGSGWTANTEGQTPGPGHAPHGSILFRSFRGFAQSVRMDVVEQDGRRTLQLATNTACFDHDESHRMTRASEDPDYGKADTFYDYQREREG
jgi:hypothetical protein